MSRRRRHIPNPSRDAPDLLSLWRHMTEDELTYDMATELSRIILVAARNCDSVPPLVLDAIDRAAVRDPMAWMSLANRAGIHFLRWELPREDAADFEASCFFLALRYGLAWARVPLLVMLLQSAANPSLIAHHVRHLGLVTWVPLDAMEDFGLNEFLEKAYGEKTKQENAKAAAVRSVFERNIVPENGAPPVLSLKVLAADPEPAIHSTDRALIAQYKSLAAPMPLVPMPPIESMRSTLIDLFPWLESLVGEVIEPLGLCRRLGQPHFHMSPLLVTGHPGVGKTYLAQKIADAAGVPREYLNLAGSTDNRALAGTARGWSSAIPTLPLVVMRRLEVANPVIIIDELDKVGGGRNGDPAATLLVMTDPIASKSFYDECLMTAADLSTITWILLANDIHRVPATLRARCRVVRMEAPRPQDFDVLLRNITADIVKGFGVEEEILPSVDPQIIEFLRKSFQQGRLQTRQLRSIVLRALSAAAAAERHGLH